MSPLQDLAQRQDLVKRWGRQRVFPVVPVALLLEMICNPKPPATAGPWIAAGFLALAFLARSFAGIEARTLLSAQGLARLAAQQRKDDLWFWSVMGILCLAALLAKLQESFQLYCNVLVLTLLFFLLVAFIRRKSRLRLEPSDYRWNAPPQDDSGASPDGQG